MLDCPYDLDNEFFGSVLMFNDSSTVKKKKKKKKKLFIYLYILSIIYSSLLI